MREPGYDKPLYILSFDHRGSFLKMLDDSDDFGPQDLAVSEISRRYQHCVHIFEAAQVQMSHAS